MILKELFNAPDGAYIIYRIVRSNSSGAISLPLFKFIPSMNT